MKNHEYSKEEHQQNLTEEEINSPEFDPEEFAPAPDKGQAASKKNDAKHSSVVFAVMCAVFAVIIAALGIIAPIENTHKIEAVREKTVLSHFKYCTEAKYVKTTADCDVYAVYYNKKVAGIGIYHTVKGFADDIEMLLTMGGKNEITGVTIVNENESQGLGDKIRDESFLKQFVGMTVFGDDTKVDLISSATISSNAVAGGVKDILETGINTFSVAKDLSLATITAEEIEKAAKKNAVEKAEETTGAEEETTGEGGKISHGNSFISPEYSDDDGRKIHGKGGANGNNGDGDMNVDGKDVTTVYETETKETETADTTTGSNSGKKTPANKDNKTKETKAPETKSQEVKPVPETKPAVETKPTPVTTQAPVVTEPPVTEPPVTEPPETEPPVDSETEQPEDNGAGNN